MAVAISHVIVQASCADLWRTLRRPKRSAIPDGTSQWRGGGTRRPRRVIRRRVFPPAGTAGSTFWCPDFSGKNRPRSYGRYGGRDLARSARCRRIDPRWAVNWRAFYGECRGGGRLMEWGLALRWAKSGIIYAVAVCSRPPVSVPMSHESAHAYRNGIVGA